MLWVGIFKLKKERILFLLENVLKQHPDYLPAYYQLESFMKKNPALKMRLKFILTGWNWPGAKGLAYVG